MLEETVAREGEQFVSKAEKLLSDQSCLSSARSTILFLKAKHMLKGSTSLDQESIEGVGLQGDFTSLTGCRPSTSCRRRASAW